LHKVKKNHQKIEKKNANLDEDYIWRFRLDNISNERVNEDLTVEYIRRQLEELLNFVVLTYNEKKVKIDGFKFIKDLNMNYDIFVKPDNDSVSKNSRNAKKKEKN
jgi:hypothetical protein